MVELEGIIQEIIFRNDNNGFTVLELKADKETVTAVGCIPFVQEGERVRLVGEWTEHPDYGRQIKVSSYESVTPATLAGIERYLSSGLIKGIGPATAKKIVEKFQKDALDIIQFHPERLVEVDGIGPAKAAAIAESFEEQRDIREIMVFLQSYDISTNYALKIYRLYGSQTVPKIKENPYRLTDNAIGIGFKKADRIALSMGISPTSPYRLASGTKYVLSQASTYGHTYCPRDILVQKASALLSVDEELIEHALIGLAVSQDVILEEVEEEGHTAVYLSSFYHAEVGVCRRLLELSMAEVEKSFLDLERELQLLETDGFHLAEQQKEAVAKALQEGVVVITGGPGTGKTTTINCIIKLLEKLGKEVVLAAPTGRAAKRMTEATGREAKTIHRLLEYGFGLEGGDLFQRNEDNPILTDVLIIDEMSMVDILLMNHLLKAVVPGTRLILVGDVDQLPSVGPGNVLRDIISSSMVPVIRLTEIFRQAQESMIVVNAHRINHGQMPFLNGKNKDFFFERKDTAEEILETLVDLCDRRIPDYFGYDPMRDIQVLTPMKKGVVGVHSLNAALQRKLNPKSRKKNEKVYGETVFREGDKVMQIKNNYQMEWIRRPKDGRMEIGQGVFNGDVGFIERIDPEEHKIHVLFDDDKKVEYEYGQLDELELAYAVSIHKSQGSEFPVVLLPLAWGPPMLMTRNLLYTAVTRAKSLVVIVGREKSVQGMVDNNYITARYSGLERRMKGMDPRNRKEVFPC